MESYRIEWKRSATKELKKIPPKMVERILRTVEQLARNPYPHQVRKLIGSEHTYRVREGDYRIIYDVLTDRLTIEIVKVGHRKDVYDI